MVWEARAKDIEGEMNRIHGRQAHYSNDHMPGMRVLFHVYSPSQSGHLLLSASRVISWFDASRYVSGSMYPYVRIYIIVLSLT